MRTYLKMAWRNLWRNKRRTIITLLSVLFAFFLALLMRSMQLGSYNMMIESIVKTTTGYIQIHALGYWDNKTINRTFLDNDTLNDAIRRDHNITLMIPRLESFALASSGNQTKGIAVIGTNPEKENDISGLEKHVVRGHYLTKTGNGVLMGEDLAKYLQVDVGDSVVLLSQGYHGVTAAGEFPVAGIVHFNTLEMNSSMIYMPLLAAQRFYSAPGRLTSLSLSLKDKNKMKADAAYLGTIDPDDLEVMTWSQMMPEVVQAIQGDNIGGQVMLGILYIVVGFGIFGTIMMMTLERKREFGIMVAVGMRRSRLEFIVFAESLCIAVVGIICGGALSIPVILYLHYHPIELTGELAQAVLEYNMEPVLPFALEPGFFLKQSLVVFILSILAALYPLAVIRRFRLVPALQGKQ